jgi:AAA domain
VSEPFGSASQVDQRRSRWPKLERYYGEPIHHDLPVAELSEEDRNDPTAGMCARCGEWAAIALRHLDGSLEPLCHACDEKELELSKPALETRKAIERGDIEVLPTQPAGTRPDGERPLPLIDGLLQEGELLVLGAARGIGKTWWGMDIVHQLARGHGKVMGTYTVRRAARVLYCHGELDPWTAYDRWQRLRGHDPLPDGLAETFERWRVTVIRRRVTHSGDGLSTSEETLDALLDGRLEATIKAEGIEVVVIDPWAVFYGGRENSNDEAELALAELRRLQLEHGLTIIVLHHFGKADTARDPEDLWRGASRLADWASTRVTLLPFYKPDQARKIGLSRQQARQYAEVKLLRRNAASPFDIAVKWNPETGQWDRWRAPEGEGDLLAGPTPADVAAKCPVPDGWSSTVAAAGALGMSRDKARALLEQARQQGLLEAIEGKRGAQGWRVNGAAR